MVKLHESKHKTTILCATSTTTGGESDGLFGLVIRNTETIFYNRIGGYNMTRVCFKKLMCLLLAVIITALMVPPTPVVAVAQEKAPQAETVQKTQEKTKQELLKDVRAGLPTAKKLPAPWMQIQFPKLSGMIPQ